MAMQRLGPQGIMAGLNIKNGIFRVKMGFVKNFVKFLENT